MPFQETSALDESVRFVTAYLAGEETMSELCRGFGISRQWGYELMRRYRAEGWSGLEPRSRAPHRPGQTMAGGAGRCARGGAYGASALGGEEAEGDAGAA